MFIQIIALPHNKTPPPDEHKKAVEPRRGTKTHRAETNDLTESRLLLASLLLYLPFAPHLFPFIISPKNIFTSENVPLTPFFRSRSLTPTLARAPFSSFLSDHRARNVKHLKTRAHVQKAGKKEPPAVARTYDYKRVAAGGGGGGWTHGIECRRAPATTTTTTTRGERTLDELFLWHLAFRPAAAARESSATCWSTRKTLGRIPLRLRQPLARARTGRSRTEVLGLFRSLSLSLSLCSAFFSSTLPL